MVPRPHDPRLLVQVVCEAVDGVARMRTFAGVAAEDVGDAEALHALDGGFGGTVRSTSITVIVVVLAVDHLKPLERLKVIVTVPRRFAFRWRRRRRSD